MTQGTLNKVYTVEELADLMRWSRNAAYERVRKGEVPGVIRVGRTIRISAMAIDRWLSADR
jgi:excisionase family DNA binding protein